MFCQAPMPYITNRQGFLFSLFHSHVGTRLLFLNIASILNYGMFPQVPNILCYKQNKLSFFLFCVHMRWEPGDKANISQYHTSNSHGCMGVNGETLQLHAVYKKLYFYHKSCKNLYQYHKLYENLYQVLQVTCTASEHAVGPKVRMIKSLSP